MKPSKKSTNKAASVARQRTKIRLGLIDAGRVHCEACPVAPVGSFPPRQWTELHERLTRGRGGDPTDPENIIPCCSECHRWITHHETEARKLGLVRARTADEHQSLYRIGE